MINISRIKNLNKLEEMKNDLNFFLNKKIVAEIYEEEGKDPIELTIERDQAREILVKVIIQIEKLSKQKLGSFESSTSSSVT